MGYEKVTNQKIVNQTLFVVMTKGILGYLVLCWVGVNVIDLPMSIRMLLGDGVVVLSTFWAGFALLDAISYTVGLIICKKEEIKQ